MIIVCIRVSLFCFVKQKTAYEMRISDWSSDVCSSDLAWWVGRLGRGFLPAARPTDRGSDRDFATPDACALSSTNKARTSVATLSRLHRSEERRVGNECVSKCRSRWSPYTQTQKKPSTH